MKRTRPCRREKTKTTIHVYE